MVRYLTLLILLLFASGNAQAGPYARASSDASNAYDPGIPGFVGPDGDGVLSANNTLNPRFVAWASEVISYAPAPGIDPPWSIPTQALGAVSGDHFDIVSLGDLTGPAITNGTAAGSITLGFEFAMSDGPGPDFAIFENGFELSPSEHFAELAYVEVSSDGEHFARFPSVSLSPGPVPFEVGTIDPTDVYNLAGKHANNDLAVSWGTPFDLSELSNSVSVTSGRLDLSNVAYIRLVDIPGNGDFHDSAQPAHPIFDLWLSEGSGGFDLEAIGMINPRISCEVVNQTHLSFFAPTNRRYQVEMSDALGSVWTPTGAAITGDHRRHQIPLPVLPATRRTYFRLAVQP